MLANGMISRPYTKEQILGAFLALSTLHVAAIAAIAGASLILILYVFSVVISALVEVCSNIAQVWTGASSIEKLLILLIAWAFFAKLSPVIARVLKSGKVL